MDTFKKKLVKFNTVNIKKQDFFNWMLPELESNGWVSVASNEATEGYIYRSKGVSGKEEIIVNIRDGYNGHMTNQFTSTANRFIDIRMLISYTPNNNVGVTGIHLPPIGNENYARMIFGWNYGNMYPDADLRIRYNCNADRMIMTVSNLDQDGTTTYLMFGRASDRFAKEYTDTGNTLITTHAYRFITGTWGVADRPTTTRQDLVVFQTQADKSISRGKVWMSELGFSTPTEGIKGTLEGIYFLNNDVDAALSNIIDDDKVVDEYGNEFSLMYVAPPVSSYPALVKNRFIAVCTKLAGED